MPSEQVIEVANDILRQLESKPDDKGKLIPPDASKGSDLFQQVESSNLTPEEKQEVYQHVAAGIGKMEMAEAKDPNTFLRENNARTRFTAEYMSAYAADYNNAVMDVAFEELSKVSFDDPAVAEKGVPKASVALDDTGWKPETIQKSKELYVGFASSVIKATETQMSKLTPDNQKFLRALVRPAQVANQLDAVNVALSSTLLLRNAQPAILNQCGLLDNDALVKDPELKQKGQFAKSAAGIVQSYANKVNSPVGEGNQGGQGALVANLRTEENVARTQAIYAALAEGGDALEAALQQHEEQPLTISPEANQLKQASSGLKEQLMAKDAADIERQKQRQQQALEAEGKKSRIASVRDALEGAGSRVKEAAANALEKKGSEQKLSEVAPDKVEIYKSLQAAVKELERMDGSNNIDAAIGDADAEKQFKEGTTAETIDRMKEEMAQMRAQDPGLTQLERSKVGQAIHSKVRDAAKAVGNKLK